MTTDIMRTATYRIGDVFEVMAGMPDDSVDLVHNTVTPNRGQRPA